MKGPFCVGGRLVLQVLLVFTFTHLSWCSLSDEIRANEVVVRFDEIYELDSWDKTDEFETSTQTAVNNYCKNSTNFKDCQITDYYNNSTFAVVLSDNSPEYFNGDIKITFHVRLPDSGVASDAEYQYVLQKSTLTDVLNNNVEAINNATGETLSLIGEERLEPIDHSLDVIMIPIVCVLFLIVVLLAIVLQCRESHNEKQQHVAMQSAHNQKDEEGIVLTTVKGGNYDAAENNDEVKA